MKKFNNWAGTQKSWDKDMSLSLASVWVWRCMQWGILTGFHWYSDMLAHTTVCGCCGCTECGGQGCNGVANERTLNKNVTFSFNLDTPAHKQEPTLA